MIGIVAAVLVVLVVGGLLFANSKKSAAPQTDTTQGTPIQKLKPEDIGLKIILRDDNKAVKFTIDKTNDIKHIAWEFSYDADVPKTTDSEDVAPGSKVTQGWDGEQDITDQGTPFTSQFRELGTCSSGHCRYDTGIQEVKMTLKVTKNDGKVYQVDDSISLQ